MDTDEYVVFQTADPRQPTTRAARSLRHAENSNATTREAGPERSSNFSPNEALTK